jgi:hypothetical protein
MLEEVSIGKDSLAGLESVLTHLEFILQLLRRTIDLLHRQSCSSNGEYKDLVSRLAPGDSVISFSWDLLLDGALGRADRLKIPAGTDSPRLWADDNLYGRMLSDFSGWGACSLASELAR